MMMIAGLLHRQRNTGSRRSSALTFSVVLAGFISIFPGAAAKAAAGDEYWESFGDLATNAYISAMAVSGRHLYVAGQFASIGGVAATNIARWDRTNWSSLGNGIVATYVPALAVGNGRVYAGGIVSRAGGLPVNNIASWDGTNWSGLGLGVGGVVRALAFVGNDLFAGGHFHSAGGVAATNIAKWDGTSWSALGPGVTWWAACDPPPYCEEGEVRALVSKGNVLYVGGDFNRAGGMPISVIAQWDGQNWSSLGGGMPGYNEGVHALAIHEDALFAGGNLRWVPGVLGPGVAKWEGTWTALPGSTFEGVRTMVVTGDELYVGPGFNQPRRSDRGIVKWNGNTWSALGSGVDGAAFELASNGTELFVAGVFNYAGGTPAYRLAIWHIPHALNIRLAAGQTALSWPATGSNFVLEASTQLPGTNWTEVPQPPAVIGNQLVVTNDMSDPSRFYRLRRK